MMLGNSTVFFSPGTYLEEIDLTVRAQIASSISCAIVFASKRGTLKPYMTTVRGEHEAMYGKADPVVSFGHDCARVLHTRTPMVWNQRVVNGALHAGSTYFVDKNSAYAPAGGNGRVLHTQFPIGMLEGFEGGYNDFLVLSFNGDLVSLNAFAMTITDGATSQSAAATFTTDNNSTLALIASSITTKMNLFSNVDDGYAFVYSEPELDAGSKRHVIVIVTPSDTTLSFGTPAVTLGATRPTCALDTDAVLFHVFAENPGLWGNNIGTKITNVDIGVRQRFLLTIGGPLVVGNTLSVQVNGGTAITQAFTAGSTSDATLELFATALQNHADIDTASVVTVPGASDNDRSIMIVAASSAPTALSFGNLSVTGGASQVAVTIRETLKGVVPNGTFTFEVYDRRNVNIPAERYTATMTNGTSGDGYETSLESQVNRAPGAGSFNVRLIMTDFGKGYTFNPVLYGSTWVVDKTVNWLSGGDDGALITSAEVNAGWDAFENRERYPVRLLINAGYSVPSIMQYMVQIAESRRDSFAILDAPSMLQSKQTLYDFRNYELNIDSSFGALYAPDLKIADPYSGRERFVPPSGHVGAQYCFSQVVGGIGKAPAGLQRGVIPGVQDVRYDYNFGARELLEPNGVNTIIFKKGIGFVIWGEYTLQRHYSVLSFVHARMIFNVAEATYADALDYTALFENNTPSTRQKIVMVGNTALQQFKDAEFLEDFQIFCDDKNNPPEVRNQDMIVVDMLLTIARVNNRVFLRGVLTPAGANFSLVETQLVQTSVV